MNEQTTERLKKLEDLKQKGLNPFYVDWIDCNTSIQNVIEQYSHKENDELRDIEVSLIGRLISWRQSFMTIRDNWEDLQLYVSSKDAPEDLQNYINKYLDIGDYLFIKGTLFKSKIGELTVRVKKLEIISKCINPFPSQYYGIQDDELKVRNRVGRALVDKSFFNTIKTRSILISKLRNYLNSLGYLEIETPILETTYGGANAVPFTTRYEALKEDFFLRIATEIPLKKAVIAGFSKVYEIGKVFRNEGIDSTHNPEFTSIEIYTVNNNLRDIIDLTERTIKHLSKELNLSQIHWNNHQIDLSKDFRRVSMAELIKDKTGIDFYDSSISLDQALSLAQKYSIDLLPFEKTVGHIFQKLFDTLICDDLIQPTFVYGFHKDVSPLAKSDVNNSEFTLRYELYIGGMEFSNGFAELNDPTDQKERFEKQQEERKKGSKEAFGIDNDYLFALQYGLPPTGGIGIGIDRLIMLFTQNTSIKEVILFPQVKK